MEPDTQPITYDTKLVLVFDTEAEAVDAEAEISADMGFSGHVTVRWAVPMQADDGKWFFPKPPPPPPTIVAVPE